MDNDVTIEQIQTIDETIKLTFDGKVVSRTTNAIKIVYKNQEKLNNLIFERKSDNKILLGTLSQMNELEVNKITSFKHSVDGYIFNCQSKLISFIFSDSLVEIIYDLILDNQILSHNILRIINKN